MGTDVFTASIDAINAEIKFHQNEIERLVTARDTISQLVAVQTAPKAVAAPKATRTTTRKRAPKSSGSRRDQIVALLGEGLSPREIGNELGIAPNYVYHVKRGLNGTDPSPAVVSHDDDAPVMSASERRAAADKRLDKIVKRDRPARQSSKSTRRSSKK